MLLLLFLKPHLRQKTCSCYSSKVLYVILEILSCEKLSVSGIVVLSVIIRRIYTSSAPSSSNNKFLFTCEDTFPTSLIYVQSAYSVRLRMYECRLCFTFSCSTCFSAVQEFHAWLHAHLATLYLRWSLSEFCDHLFPFFLVITSLFCQIQCFRRTFLHYFPFFFIWV